MTDEVRITLRLPADLHAWLAAQAKSARRSLNSEIVYRLEGERTTVEPDSESP
ncbi:MULTISPECIES: Arc family DNA-binding protein [unclassified Streptomyces]|uniref:Arc family DNA-binding protein n=1 Tax=Streptomyces sp. R35 TaxID=3238630 RepID=A0AB39SKB5_9ACTN|nr:Arc family DNA-binding protein [Streptomyces sp. NBC_00589]WTI34195.1 type II toxin-antitoxin system HicB family antitoxin [Streptomyces sp. NBC_00775]WUB32133.1 type II toxin-antitoxin system HicB family antitoxin [Streptomyces sp. NBC_00589]